MNDNQEEKDSHQSKILELAQASGFNTEENGLNQRQTGVEGISLAECDHPGQGKTKSKNREEG